MTSFRVSLATVIRAFAMLLVALGSLRLALLAANAVFLVRQGQGSVGDFPAMIAWLVVIAVGWRLHRCVGIFALDDSASSPTHRSHP